MAKMNKARATRSQPLTLAALREYGELDAFAAPGDFEPAGEWTNTYRLWFVGGRGPGFLSVSRQPRLRQEASPGPARLREDASPGQAVSADGRFVLAIERLVVQSAGTIHRTTARMTCAADALGSPLRWELESRILARDGRPLPAADVRETGVAEKGRVRIGTREREMPSAFTCNWSLFEAVQRLPGTDTGALRFDLLEDLDQPKRGHQLSFLKAVPFDTGKARLDLTGYQQLGTGVLPYTYWVDARHRLLFAISGLRAYIYDPNARAEFDRRLAARAKRTPERDPE
ncbi:MAG: hypothetical protein JXR37_15225 [Kiritimatiellae bacterium]|nr:hypothetical protein [Kiritimatiellia bacterium]